MTMEIYNVKFARSNTNDHGKQYKNFLAQNLWHAFLKIYISQNNYDITSPSYTFRTSDPYFVQVVQFPKNDAPVPIR